MLLLLLNVLMEKLSVIWGPMLVAGWETTVCLKALHVLHHVILLLPLNVMMGSLSVTWEPMVDAGWAIIVCLKDLHVLFHAILLLPLNVLMVKLCVTWEPGMMQDVGGETTVCPQALGALLHAILPLMFNVLMTCGAVTMELMLVAGWEIIAYQKELRALSFAITLLQCHVRMERFLVTWEVLQRDAGWETTVILQDLSAPCLPLEINQMLVRNQNQTQRNYLPKFFLKT